ncbi:MAG: DUF882 domain-containing protein [Devosiaceae bacterium]
MATKNTGNRTSGRSVAMSAGRGFQRLLVLFLLTALTLTLLGLTQAQAQNRTLSLYNTHTHERLTVTYKRNGRFVQAGLDQLNRFLRDWRRDEVTRIDPDLFDIVWTVYREVGASEPIHVVSAYRSPATNNMLRRRSSGVARNSQHTQGRAMDFFIPGVQASRIRAAGLRLQQGGVGFYPRSNTPFVHLDTGTVRMWPRMTRSQLQALFPNGRTIHVPADGRPLAGFEQAQRELQRGGSRASTSVQSASSAQSDGDGDIVLPGESGGGFLAALFGGGNEPEPPAPVTTAPATQVASVAPATPIQTEVASAPRERYAVPSPVLPPYASPDGSFSAPSTIAGLAVPSPTPAPTIDDIQLAALGTAPVAQTPAAQALESAFATAAASTNDLPAPTILPAGALAAAPSAQTALPPITREQQIAQSVPAPGQIAAIIEARFAEQRATQASLAGQVEQAIAVAPVAAPAVAPTVAPAASPPAPQPVVLAPVPAPVPAPTTLVATASPASVQEPGQASTLIAAAFAAQEQPQIAAQSAIDAATGTSNAVQSSTTGMTGRLYPIADDLTAALAKQSIRGSQHAALVAPTGTVTLSPTVLVSRGFEAVTRGQSRSDGFATQTRVPGS